MRYSRQDYLRFLSDEYDAQMKEYANLIDTKALVLKERGDVFVGKFLGFKDNFALFKVRVGVNMPRQNTFWTASCFIGEMGRYKNWKELSWADLRYTYQSAYSDAYCSWMSPSENKDFYIVGIKNISVDFAEILTTQYPIIAFGPKDPPLKYLSNLKGIVLEKTCSDTKDILDYTEVEESVWSPKIVSATDDFISMILADLSIYDTIAIQGPPGTGKTNRMAELIVHLLSSGNSVLATSLTNEALKALASKELLIDVLNDGRVSKTGLTLDESKEIPHLLSNEGNVCNPKPGHLSLATFFVSSGWANDIYDEHLFDYVIVDEASQAMLPMIAASKKLGKKIIWIGDQRQLSPIIVLNDDVVKKRNWMPIIKGFDTVCNNFRMPTYMLSSTYRLTKRGADITGVFYGDKLKSVSEVSNIRSSVPMVNKLGGPVILSLDLKIGDKKPFNALAMIFDLVTSLLQDDAGLKIAVLCKFKESIRALQRLFMQSSEMYLQNVKIDTVDRVQGITVDYTIFLIPNASIGYSLNSEFFNVATSRAKRCTFIVMDKSIMHDFMPKDVRRFLELAAEG